MYAPTKGNQQKKRERRKRKKEKKEKKEKEEKYDQKYVKKMEERVISFFLVVRYFIEH